MAQSTSVEEVTLGGAVLKAPSTTGGTTPLHIRDCDGDGDPDVEITWSSAPQPATVDLTDVCPGRNLPRRVVVRMLTDNAVLEAYDGAGTTVATATAMPPYEVKKMALSHSEGIAGIRIEGSQMCVTGLCWSCPDADVDGSQFIRGDVDGTSVVDSTDAIFILSYLFLGTSIECVKAADSDDTGVVDVTDALRVLAWLFIGGPPPADPHPNCGTDPTPDALSCSAHSLCESAGGDPLEETCASTPKASSSEFTIPLRSGSFRPPEGIDVEGILASTTEDRVHFLLQFYGLPDRTNNEGLFEEEIQLLDYVGGNTYIAVAEAPSVERVRELTGVRWAGAINPAFKLAPELDTDDLVSDLPWAVSHDGQLAVTFYLHTDVDPELGEEIVSAWGAQVIGGIQALRMVRALVDPGLLPEIAAHTDTVQFTEPRSPNFEPQNDVARTDVKVEPLTTSVYDLTGHGIIGMIFDKGVVDTNHPDFGDRVIQWEFGSIGSEDHATHVAGTFGGSGANSENEGGTPFQFKGMAPEAKIRSFNAGPRFNPHYHNSDDLFSNVRDNPSDLVNMSLGNNVIRNGYDCSQLGDYPGAARTVDALVLGVPDRLGEPEQPIVFVQSVGNDAGARCGSFRTIPSPATAKNSITVGNLGSGTTGLVMSSSRGPTDDDRIRPDLVAPGCLLNSTIPGGGYDMMCGTSMASPVVAGVVALLLQEWRSLNGEDWEETRPSFPHAVKAILIHTAEDLGLAGPDYQFGWGRVDAKAAVDLMRADFLQTRDTGETLIYTDVIANRGTRSVTFESDGTGEQRFTLVWDDPLASPMARSQLVNDLDLRVTDPNGRVWQPLRPDPANPTVAASEGQDTLNNVEMVIAAPVAGTWNVEILGTRIPGGRAQRFTLVRNPSQAPASGPEFTQIVRDAVILTPPWTGGGDRDFSGNGPDVLASAALQVRDRNELWLKLDMSAIETASDVTTVFGACEKLIFHDPAVEEITILSDTAGRVAYVDTNHEEDRRSSPVGVFTFVGDTNGPEAGLRTRVHFETHPIILRCRRASTTSKKRVIEVGPTRKLIPPSLDESDPDFGGNGPAVELSAEIEIRNGNEIWAEVTMTATEVGPGPTGAAGPFPLLLYTHPSPIDILTSPTQSEAFYTDVDHLDDRPVVIGGLVKEFVCSGDRDGRDTGRHTGVVVHFNPISFIEQ